MKDAVGPLYKDKDGGGGGPPPVPAFTGTTGIEAYLAAAAVSPAPWTFRAGNAALIDKS